MSTSVIAKPVRYLVAILALLAIVAGLAGVKAAQISTLMNMGKQGQKAGPPPETVGTFLAQKQTWAESLSAVGSVTAARGVTVSNESPGMVSRILFESGAIVREGQVLVDLDTSVERAQLATARARLDLARITANRSRALLATDSISKAQADADDATLKTSMTDASSLEAQIDRKTVRAPFAGRTGIRLINRGQYLGAGTPVTVLETLGALYVDFTLPQQRLADVHTGMPVQVTLEGIDGFQDGTISAIDPAIDATTRTIKLRAALPNVQQTLNPGMFAHVSVILPQEASVVVVPAMAVVHAPYGDSVFIVEDKKDDDGSVVLGPDGKPAKAVRQQFVRVGESRGDFVVVLDGVGEKQEVVMAGAFKLRNGSSVVVNNDVKPTPKLAPHPENH